MTGPPAALASRRVTLAYGGARALDTVSLEVPAGSFLGLIGESGSGKSTFARLVAGLLRPDSGEILVDGQPRTGRALHRSVQLVFQNPRSSLNPRHPVGRTLEMPLRHIMGMGSQARRARVCELLDHVQLDRRIAGRYPHELSGGEAQRVALARALAAEPRIILLDEPTSALDVLIQREILSLLVHLHRTRGLTLVLISHDLALVSETCTRLAVLDSGRLVEQGETDAVLAAPRHSYTRSLLAAARYE